MMASLMGPTGGEHHAIQLQLLGTSVLTTWLGVRMTGGRNRDIWVATGIASFCGALAAATLMSWQPYELLLWWVTSALLSPIRPANHFDPPSARLWLVVAITVLGDGFALIGRPGYLRYRRQLPPPLPDKGPWDLRTRH
jgi:hypothetical protein